MSKVYLHIGSNEGKREENLKLAIQHISKGIGKVLLSSSVYETEPWGLKNQDLFLNQAVLVESTLSPIAILNKITGIQTELGSKKSEKWGPRIIDIDILFYDKKVINDSQLEIPHPRISERNFVLIPLMEIDGDLVHPVFQKSIETLFEECKDEGEVWLHGA